MSRAVLHSHQRQHCHVTYLQWVHSKNEVMTTAGFPCAGVWDAGTTDCVQSLCHECLGKGCSECFMGQASLSSAEHSICVNHILCWGAGNQFDPLAFFKHCCLPKGRSPDSPYTFLSLFSCEIQYEGPSRAWQSRLLDGQIQSLPTSNLLRDDLRAAGSSGEDGKQTEKINAETAFTQSVWDTQSQWWWNRKEKTTFRRHNEKPSIVLGCPELAVMCCFFSHKEVQWWHVELLVQKPYRTSAKIEVLQRLCAWSAFWFCLMPKWQDFFYGEMHMTVLLYLHNPESLRRPPQDTSPLWIPQVTTLGAAKTSQLETVTSTHSGTHECSKTETSFSDEADFVNKFNVEHNVVHIEWWLTKLSSHTSNMHHRLASVNHPQSLSRWSHEILGTVWLQQDWGLCLMHCMLLYPVVHAWSSFPWLSLSVPKKNKERLHLFASISMRNQVRYCGAQGDIQKKRMARLLSRTSMVSEIIT